MLVLASTVILGSEFRETHDHISLSQIRDSLTLEGQIPVFISSRKKVAQLYPQARGSLFVASYVSCRSLMDSAPSISLTDWRENFFAAPLGKFRKSFMRCRLAPLCPKSRLLFSYENYKEWFQLELNSSQRSQC
jgi:hypothetical protein